MTGPADDFVSRSDLAVGLAARLPNRIFLRLLDRDRIDRVVARLLSAGRDEKAACLIALEEHRDLIPGGTEGPPILIGGPARSGKSILSRRIARVLDFRVVELDRIRAHFDRIEPVSRRTRIRAEVVGTLLAECRTGLVLEGDEWLAPYRHRDLSDPHALRVSLEWMKETATQFGATPLLIGTLSESPAALADRLRAYGLEHPCWTTQLDAPSFEGLVETIRAISHRTANEAERIGIPFYDIGGPDVETRLETLAQTVASRHVGSSSNVASSKDRP